MRSYKRRDKAVEKTTVDRIDGKRSTGVVVDCSRLNVREKPTLESEIVCNINALTEVLIDIDNSTNDFYKISTVSSVEGYCLKKFVAVR